MPAQASRHPPRPGGAGRGTEGRGTEVGGEDLAKYWFDVRPGGPRDGGHEGNTPMAVPMGFSGFHRGLAKGVGANEAPPCRCRWGRFGGGGFGVSSVLDDRWGAKA